MRYEILRQVEPPTHRPFRIVETLDTKDGPRSRVCDGMWATLEEAKEQIPVITPTMLKAAQDVLQWFDDLNPYSDAGTELAPVFKALRLAVIEATK